VEELSNSAVEDASDKPNSDQSAEDDIEYKPTYDFVQPEWNYP